MGSFKIRLKSSTVIPVLVGTGIILAGALPLMAAAHAAGVTAKPLNPPAVSRSTGGMIQLVGHNPCHPRNPCNPCAGKNPCNPCAGKNPCNPCAAKNPCNPCAAKNPCNPCAAKNPCGACNPCNPCAGGGAASSKCVVPRLAAKHPCNPCAAKNPCNPCAAKNPCNPCAAKNPCNPCAAKNPCNPCAAKNPCGPCNPCNPCAAGASGEITHAEAHKVYNCLIGGLKAGYAKAGVASVRGYTGWLNAAKQPYTSATHGGRYVSNYVNRIGAAEYMRFEKIRTMPVGSVIAKDSFSVKPNGKTGPGPLFVMEKMKAGFASKTGDWKYTMVMPNGMLFGETGGKNSKALKFCADCHAAVAEDQDYLLIVPEEYRRK